MFYFLAKTLAGESLKGDSGSTASFVWFCPESGVIVFEPSAGYQQNVVVSAAIHGNETAPIEILNQLIDSLFSGQLELKVRLMVIFGNLEAMSAGQRYLNVDMNRLFSDVYKQYKNCYETERATILQQVMADFYNKDHDKARFHFDLHTAIRGSKHGTFGLLPYQETERYHPDMLAWLGSVGLQALVVNHAPAATFSYFSSASFNAHSCTLELGKAKAFGENNLNQFTGIREGLKSLIQGQQIESSEQEIQVYRVAEVITKFSDQFVFNVADDVENFTEYKQGFIIAEDINPETSEEVVYQVQKESAYILFPNPKVKNGLRAGLLLKQVDRSELL